MNRGVLLFAYNTPKFNYYEMAVATAKRINHFLDLPVSVITDEESITDSSYKFDNVILTIADRTNNRDWGLWLNKGRYQAYELSPYDETILLDTDYMVNSNKLLKLFEFDNEFCCHDTTSFFMQPTAVQEVLSVYSYNTLWATVVKFKKSTYCKQIFEALEMVQKNFDHYSMIHGFVAGTYRNDYGLTLATRIVNGHTFPKENIIPWNLVHVGKNTSVYKNNDDEFNTEYTVTYDNWQRGKIKKEYITIKDTDFHVMNKDNFLELIR